MKGPQHLLSLYSLYKSEEQPFRKIHRMIDLFECILKTYTSIIISTYIQNNKLSDDAKALLSQGLRTPSLGTWQFFSRFLYKELKNDNYNWPFEEFAKSFESFDSDLNKAKSNIISLRNLYAHGATPEDNVCLEDINNFEPFLEKKMNTDWILNSNLELIDDKVYISISKQNLIIHPILLYRDEGDSPSFAFFNDIKNDKIGLLNYPLCKHYREKDFLIEFQEFLPINKWKKSKNSEFNQRIEDLTDVFKGRVEERKDLKDFAINQTKGYLSIQGNPGVGKSALIAQFFKDLNQEEIKNFYYVEYFIRRGTEQARPEYMLKYLNDKTDVIFNEGKSITSKSSSGFDLQKQLFEKWRLWGEKNENKKVLFLIDGLDEGAENEIVKYLPKDNFKNILFIYGSRPGGHNSIERLWTELPTENHNVLELEGLKIQDIRALIYEVSNKYEIEKDSKWIKEVLKKSNGNPLYVKLLCDAIENGSIEINNIDQLPKKINTYYKEILLRYSKDEIGEDLLNALYVFATAKDYLTVSHIKLINNIKQNTAYRVLSVLKEVLIEDPYTEEVLDYQLFHESFREYLIQENTFEIIQAENRILDFCSKWETLDNQWEQRYPLMFYINHLSNSKDDNSSKIIKSLSKNEKFIDTQKSILKSYEFSIDLLKLFLEKSLTNNTKSDLIYSSIALLNLFNEESSDYDKIQYLIEKNDFKKLSDIMDRNSFKNKIIIILISFYLICNLYSRNPKSFKNKIYHFIKIIKSNLMVSSSKYQYELKSILKIFHKELDNYSIKTDDFLSPLIEELKLNHKILYMLNISNYFLNMGRNEDSDIYFLKANDLLHRNFLSKERIIHFNEDFYKSDITYVFKIYLNLNRVKEAKLLSNKIRKRYEIDTIIEINYIFIKKFIDLDHNKEINKLISDSLELFNNHKQVTTHEYYNSSLLISEILYITGREKESIVYSKNIPLKSGDLSGIPFINNNLRHSLNIASFYMNKKSKESARKYEKIAFQIYDKIKTQSLGSFDLNDNSVYFIKYYFKNSNFNEGFNFLKNNVNKKHHLSILMKVISISEDDVNFKLFSKENNFNNIIEIFKNTPIFNTDTRYSNSKGSEILLDYWNYRLDFNNISTEKNYKYLLKEVANFKERFFSNNFFSNDLQMLKSSLAKIDLNKFLILTAFISKINSKNKVLELYYSLEEIDTEYLLRNKEMILEYIESIKKENKEKPTNLSDEASLDYEIEFDRNDIYLDFILKRLKQSISQKTTLNGLKKINNYLDNTLSSERGSLKYHNDKVLATLSNNIGLFINLHDISELSSVLIAESKSYSESINLIDKIENIYRFTTKNKLGTAKIKLIYELTYQGFYSEAIKIIDEIDLSLRLQGYCRICLAYFNKKNQVEFHKLFNKIKDELYNTFNISNEDIKRYRIKQERTDTSIVGSKTGIVYLTRGELGTSLPDDLHDILDYWLRFNELDEVIKFIKKNYTKIILYSENNKMEDLLVKIFRNLHKLGRTEEIGDLLKKSGYKLALNLNLYQRLNMEIVYSTDIDFFKKLLITKFNKNIDSKIVKGIEKVLPIHLADLRMVNYLTCYLLDFPSSLKSLFRKYYMHKLIFDYYNKEELDILSKNTNFNWALDLLNKMSNKVEDEYLFSNINSWIDKIDDDDDKQQIKLWERMVSKGRITENEFNKNIKDFL